MRRESFRPPLRRVIQDGHQHIIWIRCDFVPDWDRIRQFSKFISVENRTTFVANLIFLKVIRL